MEIKENNKRTIARTISYRFWVMVSFFVTGFIFSMPLDAIVKLSIAGWTIGLVLYFIHEKIWDRFNLWKDGYYDRHARTAGKTISWRLLSVVAVWVIGLFVGVSTEQSFAYSLVSNAMFLGIHYIHERIWNTYNWGKMESVSI